MVNEGVDHYLEEERLRKDKEISLLAQQVKRLESSIQSIHGASSYGGVSLSDLTVAPGEIFLAKFKMPDLTMKYDRSGDPYIHLKIYIGKLGPCATDERLRVHLFPKSMSGAAL